MFCISKDFTFAASHTLRGLRPGHKCGRLHGHNYVVRVEVSSSHTTGVGFVVDYGDLAPFGDYLDKTFDHRDLNDHLDQPTAENLAKHLHEALVEIMHANLFAGLTYAIGVSETPKTWAWYRP